MEACNEHSSQLRRAALVLLALTLLAGFSTAQTPPAVSVKVAKSDACDNPVEVGPTRKLVVSWSRDHLCHDQADPLGCIDVTGLARFQVQVKGLPADLKLIVRAQGKNAGTAKVNSSTVTFTLPANTTNMDNWTVEVHSSSSDGQQGANTDSAWVKLAYV
jgi:hypothetical protein